MLDPVLGAPFTISKQDRVATAGSCFAQHLSNALSENGFTYLVTEPGPHDRHYGIFPARFGNVYSTRQLLQLFQRAYGLFEPHDSAWKKPDGSFIDPFRPQVEKGGYASLEALEADRASHLAATRKMFETCNVFIFTLGLTEIWHSTVDGAVFPLAPGVVGTPDNPSHYAFHNLSPAEMAEDLRAFIIKFRIINPSVRIILTVSPVPLIATYEERHVLTSTIYSKSALRVVAEIVSNDHPAIAYFPSYEMITGHHTGYSFFESDLRSVSRDGVAYVMSSFFKHFAMSESITSQAQHIASPTVLAATFAQEMTELAKVVCDEEALDQ